MILSLLENSSPDAAQLHLKHGAISSSSESAEQCPSDVIRMSSSCEAYGDTSKLQAGDEGNGAQPACALRYDCGKGAGCPAKAINAIGKTCCIDHAFGDVSGKFLRACPMHLHVDLALPVTIRGGYPSAPSKLFVLHVA